MLARHLGRPVRWTSDRLLPPQKDEFYSASIGYSLPSVTLLSVSVTHEKVGARQAFYGGITLTQILTTCSKCQTRGRAY